MSDDQSEIVLRLRSVAQDLGRLRILVEADVPCCQVLPYLGRVQWELGEINSQILSHQIKTSEAIIQLGPSREIRLSEVRRLFELYIMLLQTT